MQSFILKFIFPRRDEVRNLSDSRSEPPVGFSGVAAPVRGTGPASDSLRVKPNYGYRSGSHFFCDNSCRLSQDCLPDTNYPDRYHQTDPGWSLIMSTLVRHTTLLSLIGLRC